MFVLSPPDLISTLPNRVAFIILNVMTLANMITILRLICILPLLILFFSGPQWLFFTVLAFVLLSDLVDGALARAQRQITDLGKVLDPLADKALFISLFIALALRGDLPETAVVALVLPQAALFLGFLWLRSRTAHWVIIEARLLGKASSTLLSLGLVGLLLTVRPALYVVYSGIALSYVAALDYLLVALRRVETRELRRERGGQL